MLAEVLGAEAALGRIQFVSGTHAIATALFSVLRPGDELLAVAGRHVRICSHYLCVPVDSAASYGLCTSIYLSVCLSVCVVSVCLVQWLCLDMLPSISAL